MPALPPDLRLASARPEDAGALRELQRSVLAEGRWFATRPDEHRATAAEIRASIEALRGQPGSLLLLAWDGARLAGFVAVHGERLARLRHVGRVELMVAQRDRGRGLGTALLLEAIARAGRGGVLRKLSLAVFADNEPALRLYRRAGFAEEGRRRGEYRFEDGSTRDDVLLARWLDGV